MPIYEYDCECGAQFERIKRMTEHTATHKCPKCGKEADQHINPRKGISGFYEEEGWEVDCPMDAM